MRSEADAAAAHALQVQSNPLLRPGVTVRAMYRFSSPHLRVLSAVAWSMVAAGCGAGPDDHDVLASDEGDLSLPILSFQVGVSPSASYTGATDSAISENAPASNQGGATSITVDRDFPTGTGKSSSALLRFELGSIPANA